MRCPNGHEIEVSPNGFLSRGLGCKRCSGRCPDAAEEKVLRAIAEQGYELVTPYVDSQTKVAVKCKNGHALLLLPSQITRKQNCIQCLGRTLEQASEKFSNNLKERGWESLGQYVNNNTPVEVRCNKGHEIPVIPVQFNKGVGCKVCAGQCPETSEKEFLALAEKLRYQVSGEYVNNHTNVRMLCPVGHTISMRPGNFKSGKRCGECHPGGYDPEKNGYLYILKSECSNYIKVGISNVPESRLSSLEHTTPFSFSIINVYRFESGHDASDVELEVKSRYSAHCAFPAENPTFDGYTEWYQHSDSQILTEIHSLCMGKGATVHQL
ncbi:MAG: GIY-YIG nuclease family protein [Planctomycetes bacterium]|nr:GIY-YIG nuclease family protein [Planctomycetota bacterium]